MDEAGGHHEPARRVRSTSATGQGGRDEADQREDRDDGAGLERRHAERPREDRAGPGPGSRSPGPRRRPPPRRMATSRGRPARSGVRAYGASEPLGPAHGRVIGTAAGVSPRHSILRRVPPSAVVRRRGPVVGGPRPGRDRSTSSARGSTSRCSGASATSRPCRLYVERRDGAHVAVRRGLSEGGAGCPSASGRGSRRAHYEPATRRSSPSRCGTMWAGREAGHPARTGAPPRLQHLCPPRRRVPVASGTGRAFRQAMCGLVRAVLGVEAELMLRAGYEERRAAHGGPPA